jgi:cytochrome b involved in lipid metabolism
MIANWKELSSQRYVDDIAVCMLKLTLVQGDNTNGAAIAKSERIDPHDIDFAKGQEWPTFKRAEVEKHDGADGKIWVTYKNGVFDISDFIENHPGGNKILLAKGKAIDPFWRIYQQHLNSALPLQILKGMQVRICCMKLPRVRICWNCVFGYVSNFVVRVSWVFLVLDWYP